MCGQRLGTGVFRLRGRSVAYAVPLLLVLAVILVAALAFNVANLDPGGETIPQAPAAGTPPPTESYLPDPIVTQVMAVLFGFVLLGGAILFFRNRARVRAPAKPFTWWAVLARALGVALLVAVLIAWPRAIQAARERAGTQANATAGGGTFTTVWPAAAAGPIEIFLLVAVLLAVAWLAYLFRRARMHGGAVDWEDGFPVPAARVAAAATVREAIQEIEAGGEVRAVIVACFQRFCALLGARGITKQDPLTPRELERLAVNRLRVSRDDSATLTALFEEARYSEHALGDMDRTRAIDSLGRIRAALEG